MIGKCSTFGGPADTGVTISEGLALIQPGEAVLPCYRHLFIADLNVAHGLARQLNPLAFYCAMRWDYQKRSRAGWRASKVVVRANGQSVVVIPVDWGPNIRTDRIIDLSKGAALALRVHTDDLVTVEIS